MDIADIRKKAKAAKVAPSKVAVETPTEVVEAAEAVEVESTVDELPLATTVDSAAALAAAEEFDLSDVDLDSEHHSDALDRLFEVDLSGDLATDEVYQETLQSKVGEDEADLQQYLSFQLSDEEYALDITQINEIIKFRELTEIPRVPDFILGIISLRGVVVPVFDLKRRFSLGRAELTSASRIVVCQGGEMTAGLLVDRINQVITLSDGSMEPPPAVLSGIDRELVQSVGRFQGRMVIVLNLTSVLNVDLT